MKVDRATYVKRILRMARSRSLTLADAQRPELELWRDPTDRFVAFYAPFDHVSTQARLAVIGATPGHGKVPTALNVFRDALVSGRSERTAMRLAKEEGAFLGMRSLISSWLDVLGLSALLELQSCESLWTEHRSLLHATSAVRYPTFVRKGDLLVPYTGGKPSPVDRPRLRDMVETVLGPELRRCRNAILLPVGNGARDAVRHLVARGVVSADRCVFGLPHPSGQSAGRHKDVFDNRRRLRANVRRAWAATSTPADGAIELA